MTVFEDSVSIDDLVDAVVYDMEVMRKKASTVKLELNHDDHGIDQIVIGAILADNPRVGFFAETFPLPDEEPDVQCSLYGPIQGDDPVPESEVSYEVRNGRSCASRMIDRPTRPVREVTIIGIGKGNNEYLLFTAYGGKLAEREPGDTSLPNWEEVVKAREFWKKHALSISG